MTRLLAAAPVLAVGLAGSPAAPVPKDLGTRPIYHPAGVGATRVLASAGTEFTYVTAAVDREDGAEVATVDVLFDGRTVRSTRVRVSDAGVYRLAVDGLPFDPPDCVLRYPYRPGDTWRVRTWGNLPADLRATAGAAEEVEVPAGRFKAARVTYEGTVDGAPAKSTCWYGPHVGLVKTQDEVGGTGRTWELVSFTPGKD